MTVDRRALTAAAEAGYALARESDTDSTRWGYTMGWHVGYGEGRADEAAGAAHRLRPSDRPELVDADAVLKAAEQRGREQAARDIEAAGQDPYLNLAWMYPDQAAAIARGEKPRSY